MRLILNLLIIILISPNVLSNDNGEIEITTEDGIEVFQNEKYYILKKNVKIKSNNFILDADEVKINFEDSLYDITELNAKGNVNFDTSQLKMSGSGETLNFEVKIENLKVEGLDSKIITKDINMFSDGYIEINNQNGKFFLKGLNSKLVNENILIIANSINGIFSSNNNDITFLEVFDKEMSYVKNNNTEMYAKKIIYNSDTSMIELIDSVTIIRNEEKITGDYGTLDTKNNSYKIKSNNKTKVKVIIQDND